MLQRPSGVLRERVFRRRFRGENQPGRVTAPQPIIDEIRRILALADVPRRQVVIDAVVTEVSGEAAKNLGIEWGGATTGPYGLQFGELASIGGLFQRLERVVATIHLLEKEGKARIRSNPRLVVLDGEEREIRVTREEYYAIVTGTPAFPTTSLETISAGVILKVRPYVVGGEEIVLTLSPEVSNVVGGGVPGPSGSEPSHCVDNGPGEDGRDPGFWGVAPAHRGHHRRKGPSPWRHPHYRGPFPP